MVVPQSLDDVLAFPVGKQRVLQDDVILDAEIAATLRRIVRGLLAGRVRYQLMVMVGCHGILS